MANPSQGGGAPPAAGGAPASAAGGGATAAADIRAYVNGLGLDVILRTAQGGFDWAVLNTGQKQKVVLRALNCVLNGPVAANTKHDVPGDNEKVSITDICGKRVNNNAWRALCQAVCDSIKGRPDCAALIANCQMTRVMGGLYPDEDWEPRRR